MAEQFALNLSLNLKDFRAKIAGVRSDLASLGGAGIQNLKGVFTAATGSLNVMANAVHVARGAVDGLRASFALLTQFSEQGQQLEEGASKFEAVFKEATGSANQFAVTLAAQVGRSVVQVKNAMADAQGVLSGFGFDRSKAAEITQTLAALAIDLASFNNTSDEEAFGALKSGLLGEAEALKKFGVAITEATVQQQAFQLGFDPNNLSEQEKVLTRLAIVTKQTADAQGDATRTGDSFANQAKRLSGVFFDLAANIGKGINEALKPALSGITSFFSSNDGQIKAATAGLTDAITTGLASALQFIEPIAARAGQAILAIFTDLPASIAAVQAAASRFGDFLASIFNIITGNTGKAGNSFTELQRTGVSAFERLEAAFTSPGIIKGLGYLRIGVALLAGGFGELLAAGQLVGAGLIAILSASTIPLQKMLAALGLVSPAAKQASDELNALIESGFDKSIELAEDANNKIIEIGKRTAQEIESATYDVQNADKIARVLRVQVAAKREATKSDKEGAAAAAAAAAAEAAKAKAAAEAAEAAKKSEVTYKAQKEQQEALKKATEETQRVEEQLADARAKSTETLKDDLALIRERIAGELKAAKTAEEASQIRKRGILQETALIEDAQRKQAEATKRRIEEEKKAAKALRDFIADQDRGRRRGQGLNAGADAEEAIGRVAAQAGNIRNASDGNALIAEVDATERDALDKRTEAMRKISESMANLRAQLADARANGDFEEAARLQDQLRENAVEYAAKSKENSEASKRASTAAEEARRTILESVEQAKKQAEAEKAKAEELAKLGTDSNVAATADAAPAAQSPVEGAVDTLKGVLEGANTQLRAGLEGLSAGLASLVTAAQEILSASTTIFPQALASIDLLLTTQKMQGDAMINLATSMRDKLNEVAGVSLDTAAKVNVIAAEIKLIKAATTGVVDARTAGL